MGSVGVRSLVNRKQHYCMYGLWWAKELCVLDFELRWMQCRVGRWADGNRMVGLSWGAVGHCRRIIEGFDCLLVSTEGARIEGLIKISPTDAAGGPTVWSSATSCLHSNSSLLIHPYGNWMTSTAIPSWLNININNQPNAIERKGSNYSAARNWAPCI